MTVEELESLQSQYGYDDMPLGDFASKLRSKYGNLDNVKAALKYITLPSQVSPTEVEPTRPILPTFPHDPRQLGANVRGRIGNAMSNYAQGLQAQSRGMAGLTDNPSLLNTPEGRETAMSAINYSPASMGMMKAPFPTQARGLLKYPFEEQFIRGALPETATHADVYGMMIQDRFPNALIDMSRTDPELAKQLSSQAIRFFRAIPDANARQALINRFQGTHLDNVAGAMKELNNIGQMPDFNLAGRIPEEVPQPTGLPDKRMSDYYKYSDE